jgi:hypothetical protein
VWWLHPLLYYIEYTHDCKLKQFPEMLLTTLAHKQYDIIRRLPVWNVKIKRYLASCMHQFWSNLLRDRPFNLKGGGYGFLFRSEFFFRTTQELEYLFFCHTKHEFFFQNSTLGYMTKTLNQIIFFFPPPKSEYFFQQHWESEYFFRKKT